MTLPCEQHAVVTTIPDLSAGIRKLLDTYEEATKFPFGPPAVDAKLQQAAGEACVRLCEGNQDTARTLWRLVVQDCGGYLPRSAAMALIRASNTLNLVPDVTAPEPS